MKHLLILRHAKSSWRESGIDDHDRPLNERGQRDAPRMGRLLASAGRVPERIVSSTAARARTTAALVAEACGYDGDLLLTEQLYLAGPADCIDVVRAIPNNPASVMLVAHNPGLEQLVELLGGRGERMPTAALAVVALRLDDWSDLRADARGELLELWRPKELPAE